MSSYPSDPSALHPVTAEGEKVCRAVDTLAGYLSERAARNDPPGAYAASSVARLREAGVLAACVPREDGGYGVTSLTDLGALVARLAAADASVAVAASMHLALSWYYARTVRCTPVAEDDCARQRKWLRAIGERRMVVCSSVAEPGNLPWRLRTTAVRTRDGWTVNGRKALASISVSATHFYTRLRAETDEGPLQATAMIPLDTAGVEVRDDWDGFGLRGSGSGTVHFRDVRLPPDALLPRGPWGQVNALGYEGRAASSAPLLAVQLGLAEAAHALAVEDLTAARGRERARSTGVRAAVAEMAVQLAVARGTLRSALHDIDGKVTHTAPRTLPAATGSALMTTCVSAGIAVERATTAVTDLAMQVYGGRSYLAWHPLNRICRDLRAGWFMRPYAPSEQWADFLADSLLCEEEPS